MIEQLMMMENQDLAPLDGEMRNSGRWSNYDQIQESSELM